MTPAAGADLAAAVAAAGGLGLLGGGYGDRSWFETESAKITRNDVGCGFITWSVAQQPDLLDFAIERHSRAIMLSFADPAPFAPRIKQAEGLSSARSIPSTKSDEQPMSGPMLSLLKARKRAATAKQPGRRCRSCRQWWTL